MKTVEKVQQPKYKTYTSPFPRNKSNWDALRCSKVLSNESANDKVLFDVPASVTKSYMKRNSFYFDLKSYKTTFHKEVPNEKNNISTKLSQNLATNKNNALSNACVIDKSHLSSLLMADKSGASSLDSLLLKKPQLLTTKDKLKGLIKSKNKYKHNDSKIIEGHLLNNILNLKDFQIVLNKNFGKVPE